MTYLSEFVPIFEHLDSFKLKDIACPVQPVLADWAVERWRPSSSPGTIVLEALNGRAPSSARLSCRRSICFDTPSQEVFRDDPSPGLVARFINIAPHHLQAGRDAAPPPLKTGTDWWTEGVSVELRPRPRPPIATCEDTPRSGEPAWADTAEDS